MTEHNAAYAKPKMARIMLDGWAGWWHQIVEVIGETPKRYRCRAFTDTKLAGRNHWAHAGDVFLVPRHAVRFVPRGKPGPIFFDPLPEDNEVKNQ